MSDLTPVVTACDRAFLPGLRALLSSLKRFDPARQVYLLDCGISDAEYEALFRFFPGLTRVIPDTPGSLPAPSVGSRATYARLSIGNAFRDHQRILYLDADTVVMSSLEDLDVLTIEEPQIIAACLEPYTPTFASANGISDFAKLGFSGAEPYFNAGVMLIDVGGWRRAKVYERALEYLGRRDVRIALFDQEALNVALEGQWRELKPEWNVSRYWMRKERRALRPNILDDARIVHFLSAEKPWMAPGVVHPWLMEKYETFAWSPAETCAK